MKASRLASQFYIGIPLIVGQLYAQLAGIQINWALFSLVQAFGLFIQLFIVYANDLADLDSDRINKTYTLYSGGSRVLVDGDLTTVALRRGAILSVSAALLCCLIMGLACNRWLLVPLGITSVLLLLAYSYPPVRLNYRGGGEILQMMGMGIVLPLFGWHAQAGSLTGFPTPYLVLLAPTMLACAIGTSLPDEYSDRIGGKRSATVLLGQKRAQLTAVLLHAISLAILLLAILESPGKATVSIIVLACMPFLLLLTQFGGNPGSGRLMRFGFASIAATLVITLCSVGATRWRGLSCGAAGEDEKQIDFRLTKGA